jgi:FkbM family methyltransferase
MNKSAFIKRLFGTIMRRIPVGSHLKRELLEVTLLQTEEVAYARLRDQGFCPGGIIDVGAHQGDWIRLVRQLFPDPPALSIEAREEQRALLTQICSALPETQFVIALLGSESKQNVPFHIHGSGSSMFAERSDALRAIRQMQMRTLDEVVSSDIRIKSPIFLKLDIQGAELEVLRGAERTLSLSEVVQLEVAILNYNEGAPSSADVIALMDANGFAIYDIAGFIRPTGADLVQLDILFVKKNSSLRHDFFRFHPSEEHRKGIEVTDCFISC